MGGNMPWGDDWGFDDPVYDTPDFSQIPEMTAPTFEAPLDLNTSWLDDPYADWGGGAGGDGTKATDLGSSAWSWLEKLLKGAGLATTNKDGSLNLGSLLGILTATGATLNGNSKIGGASEKWEDAANKSNEFAQGQYNTALGRMQPYVDAGANALAQLSAGTPTLADKFVSKGTPSTLAALIGKR